MSLGAALTDKARVIGRGTGPKPTRIEGTKVTKPEEGEWFKCRLELPKEDEGAEDSGRFRRQVTPSLMLGKRNLKGEKNVVRGRDQIRVKSNQILEQTGGAEDEWTFEVKGRPEPIRKRRAVIGYQVNLVKVEATDQRTTAE